MTKQTNVVIHISVLIHNHFLSPIFVSLVINISVWRLCKLVCKVNIHAYTGWGINIHTLTASTPTQDIVMKSLTQVSLLLWLFCPFVQLLLLLFILSVTFTTDPLEQHTNPLSLRSFTISSRKHHHLYTFEECKLSKLMKRLVVDAPFSFSSATSTSQSAARPHIDASATHTHTHKWLTAVARCHFTHTHCTKLWKFSFARMLLLTWTHIWYANFCIIYVRAKFSPYLLLKLSDVTF
jgi:hypothetical protein